MDYNLHDGLKKKKNLEFNITKECEILNFGDDFKF